MNLLDTCICVDILRGKSARLLQHMKDAGAEQLSVSSITAAELFVGALKSSDVGAKLDAVELLLSGLKILSFDSEAARVYGVIRSRLERSGRCIGELDMLIAAHAVAVDAVLVTHNTREFSRVEELTVDAWS